MPDPLTCPSSFVTFYSVKGGVGRTMALANVACILAGGGRRVLCMDLDLEAPGLTYLAAREKGAVSATPGFVDLIYDLIQSGPRAPIADASKPFAFLDHTCKLPIPKHALQREGGALAIMPAGRMDRRYEDRLQAMDLGRLYAAGKGKPILKHIRNVIAQSGRFDCVLIDSRTGFSDEAGACVRDLSDRLVILLGLSRQNVAGTARFLARLRHNGASAKAMAFVASPIPVGEGQLPGERIAVAERELADAWGEPVHLALRIPYHPRLALDEGPSIFEWSGTELGRAYERLADAVRRLTSDTAGG